jgi:IMP cyclohydrolase
MSDRASPEVLHGNINRLANNPYPGRAIIQGLGAAADRVIQVYWLMGRSEGSRARTLELVQDPESDRPMVSTRPFNLPEGTDTSLIIYNALRSSGDQHVVTNGDHTDTIMAALAAGDDMETALATREYEPDDPNFTPRISGMIDLSGETPVATSAIIRKRAGSDLSERAFHSVRLHEGLRGIGFGFHTYMGDGNPLPAFEGKPYSLKLGETVEDTAEFYWNILNPDNRVSLVAKSVDPENGEEAYKIINRNS